MARTININQKTIDEFSAFDKKMIEKITGLAIGDFTVAIYYNKTLINPADVEFTLGEYGATGSYWVEWKPNQLGFWEVEVKVEQTKQYWYETYDVVLARDPGELSNKIFDIRGTVVWNSQRDELVALAWLTENGRLVNFAGNCYWDFYDSENNILFSLQQLSAFSTGIYRIKKSNPNFNLEENFYYIVKIHDGVELRQSALGLITVI